MDNIIKSEIDKSCSDAENFCESIYQSIFAKTFEEVVKLHDRMKSTNKPITDSELAYIITVLPLDLFTVSESLNKLRLKLEVTKLENSRREVELKKAFTDTSAALGKTTSVLNQIVKDELVDKMTEYKVFEVCYASIITRVENQLTYSRELIMGAKKIWDSRRAAESSNPIKPIDMSTLLPYPT